MKNFSLLFLLHNVTVRGDGDGDLHLHHQRHSSTHLPNHSQEGGTTGDVAHRPEEDTAADVNVDHPTQNGATDSASLIDYLVASMGSPGQSLHSLADSAEYQFAENNVGGLWARAVIDRAYGLEAEAGVPVIVEDPDLGSNSDVIPDSLGRVEGDYGGGDSDGGDASGASDEQDRYDS